jgi:NADH:ubiquinone oxidoreductase subunit B-like Fe-S oxidoreductase
MFKALITTYEAIPAPKIVVASGACAINGGPYIDSLKVSNGVDSIIPVDLYIPGCPPHPATILDGLLRILDKIQ